MTSVAPKRIQELQKLVNLLQSTIATGDLPSKEAVDTTRLIFTALNNSVGFTGNITPGRLPVCQHFKPALDNIHQGPNSTAPFAGVLREIEPKLAWRQRSSSKSIVDDGSDENIANALLIGSTGLEVRHDVMIGMTLMAPNTLYSNHQHPPKEIYMVLSAGDWRQNTDEWHAPGKGGFVYNPANIIHAFRSNDTPLLAIWCLWCGD